MDSDLNTGIHIPSLDKQKEITVHIEGHVEASSNHVINMCLLHDREVEAIYLPIGDERRVFPSGDDVERVVELLMVNNKLSKGAIAKILGISPKGNVTLNRWLKGDKSPIPYTAWRLLCSYAGCSIDLKLEK